MNKCVKITCTVKVTPSLIASIQKDAQALELEGSLQVLPPEIIKIIACGFKDAIDSFVDTLYKAAGSSKKPFSIVVEPFLKDKDYRNIFRVLA